MKKLGLPKNMQGYKQYGNKYCKAWINTITRDNTISVYMCGEREVFDNSPDGIKNAEQWLNEKRLEVAKALKLVPQDEKLEG